jgi:hypothetical protein
MFLSVKINAVATGGRGEGAPASKKVNPIPSVVHEEEFRGRTQAIQ